MSQPLGNDRNNSQRLSTTSAKMVAIKIRFANKHIILQSIAQPSFSQSADPRYRLTEPDSSKRKIWTRSAYGCIYVASLIPTTLAPMLASALEASVIPVYMRLRTQGGRKQTSRLFSTLLNLLIIGCVLFTIGLIVFKTPLLGIIDPGSQFVEPDAFVIAQNLAPFIFPVLGLMTLNSFMECLLNAEGKFGWPAYAGLLVPLTTATCVLLGGKSLGVLMLCIGSVIGQLLQLCIIHLSCPQSKDHLSTHHGFKYPSIEAHYRAAWPALFAGVISMASPIVDTFFGSYQPARTIAALTTPSTQ